APIRSVTQKHLSPAQERQSVSPTKEMTIATWQASHAHDKREYTSHDDESSAPDTGLFLSINLDSDSFLICTARLMSPGLIVSLFSRRDLALTNTSSYS